MKFINELKEGERIESVFAVTDKQMRTTTKGKPFISMRLSDKTGAVPGVAWDNAEALSARFERGDIVEVRAEVGSYQGGPQLVVQNIRRVDPGEHAGRFLPQAEKDVDKMASELVSIVGTVRDPATKRLVLGFLEDGPFMEKFKAAPAAKGMHHVFSGGLLQHTLKVVRLCDIIFGEYKENDPEIAALMSRDLLIAGAVLHDIGKVEELERTPGFDYTMKGRLLGHVSLGLMMVKERIDRTEGMSPDAADVLMHMILSHHGELEFGSPKRPKCMEAFILHYADNLDAKLQGLRELTEKDTSEGKFTAYHRLYERYFYKGRPYGDVEEEDTGE